MTLGYSARETICIAAATLFMASYSGAAIQYRGTTRSNLQTMYEEARSQPGALTKQAYDYVRVRVPSTGTYYYFTRPNHTCHPAVVVQEVYEENGAIWIKAQGYTAGDHAAFQEWLKGFEAMHKKLAQQIRANRRAAQRTEKHNAETP